MKIYENENQKYIKAALAMGTPEEQERLKTKLDAIDWSVLDNLAQLESGHERGVFAPLDAVEVSEIEARREEFKEIGLKAIRECKVGAVLLAGGQGTRLGSDKPKGCYNVGLTRDYFLFQSHVEKLLTVRERYGVTPPLYIMTSDKNHTDTVAFFEEHDYFGYGKENIGFFSKSVQGADF